MVAIFDVEPYELYKFPSRESVVEIRNKLFKALENDEDLLLQVYKFYQVIKNFRKNL